MKKNNKKMVSRRDAAEYLRCSLQTVTNWVESGILKGRHINGRLFVDADTLHAVADTAKDIENAKQKLSSLLSEKETAVRELNEEIARKREELMLFKHSAASKVTRDIVKSIVTSYGDLIPKYEADVLVDVAFYGNVDSTAKKFGIDSTMVLRVADKACRRIGYARYDRKVKENENLKRRISELEFENRNLRNGVVLDEKSMKNPILHVRISECDLSVRTINCLYAMGIDTVGDLATVKLETIAKYRNVGKKTLAELEEFGRMNGIDLK